MSILVKGMKMPTRCEDCPVCHYMERGTITVCGCKATMMIRPIDCNSKPYWCPLVEVPTPHGRLIDADAFIAEQRHLYCENCERRKGMKNGKVKFVYDIGDAPCRACGYGDVLDDLEDAPAVIKAEEG